MMVIIPDHRMSPPAWSQLVAWVLLSLVLQETWATHGSPPVIPVRVDSSAPHFTTQEQFFSLGMDSNLIRNRWQTFDFSSVRLRTLAQSLSPAYLRLAGTDSDRMVFDDHGIIYEDIGLALTNSSLPTSTGSGRGDSRVHLVDPTPTLFPPTNFTFTHKDWDLINRFAEDIGWRIMFGLNAQLRHGNTWDPSNAIALLKYSIKQGYAHNLDFELGNEPDLYFTEKHLHVISGKQLAKDYGTFRRILDSKFRDYFSSSRIYGPALSNAVPVISHMFLRGFLDNIQSGVLDGVTWHQYYGGSELKYVENYTDPDILDMYVGQCEQLVKLVTTSRQPHLKIWQGETSSTFAPPGGDIDETYVAGFMLLDKLGLSAYCGMDLVIRQTFYGFWFALVDEHLHPTPNYWVSLLFRKLVGQQVFTVDTRPWANRSVRIYAHCVSRRSAEYYNNTAVVVYAMNLYDNDVVLDLSAVGHEVFQYSLTPGEDRRLLSNTILLNGQTLHMVDDETMPRLFGLFVLNPRKIVLPAKTFAYYVVADANAQGCLQL